MPHATNPISVRPPTNLEEAKMRTSRLLTVPAALAAIALTAVPAASPASAAKPAEPAESGVVLRFDNAMGGHQFGTLMTDVGGDMLPLVVVVGWDDAVAYCTGGPPVHNGVEQVAFAPSGHATIVVHNSDAPILVFDVSGVSEEDFFDKCASGEIVPLATGTAKGRPIIQRTESAANVKIKTRGVVTDATGQDWTMQAFTRFHVDFGDLGAEELTVLKEWVTLTAL